MTDGFDRNLFFGPFELSSRERVLRRNGVALPLGSRALEILIYLAERPGEVITKQALYDQVWPDVTVEEGTIRVHVAAIRKALGDGQFGNRYIANIKGRGYSFVGTVVPINLRETAMIIANIDDYRKQCESKLPRFLYDYISGGSYQENTLRANIADLQATLLRQRVLVDESRLNFSIDLWGQAMSLPVILGPVGMAGMYSSRGEVKAANAAKAVGIPFTLSTMGVCDVHEVAQKSGVPPWLQLYMLKDRGFVKSVIERSVSAGSKVLVFTVDLPTPGRRYSAVHDGMEEDPTLLGMLGTVAAAAPKNVPIGKFAHDNFDVSTNWKDIEWIRSIFPGKIILKGILDPEDAKRAVQTHIDGILVSNHGGRQLDSVASTVCALPRVVDAVQGKVPVFMDGGIRSGLDVLKALALGAKACFVGRAWAYALGAAGESGVRDMLDILREELRVAMILTGCSDVSRATSDLLLKDLTHAAG